MTTERRVETGGEDVHDQCLICGYNNPWSLGMRFYCAEGEGVRGHFRASPRLQGYEGILHGGVLAALLDSAMVHCLFRRGVQGVTGDLHVRFLESAPCDAELEVRADLVSTSPPLHYLKAEVRCGDLVVAWGKATFVERGGRTRAAARGRGTVRSRGASTSVWS